MIIASKKVFIEKIQNGYKLEATKQFKRTLYYLTNKKEELTVSASLIKKLESARIIDSDLNVFLNGTRVC